MALILGRRAYDELVDAAWALFRPEVFTMLMQQRGWSVADAKVWLVEMSRAAVDDRGLKNQT